MLTPLTRRKSSGRVQSIPRYCFAFSDGAGAAAAATGRRCVDEAGAAGADAAPNELLNEKNK